MDEVDLLLAESAAAQTYDVQTAILQRVATGNDVRRNVHRRARTALHHYVAADVAELVNENAT